MGDCWSLLTEPHRAPIKITLRAGRHVSDLKALPSKINKNIYYIHNIYITHVDTYMCVYIYAHDIYIYTHVYIAYTCIYNMIYIYIYRYTYRYIETEHSKVLWPWQ